jgi:hypothetical protein
MIHSYPDPGRTVESLRGLRGDLVSVTERQARASAEQQRLKARWDLILEAIKDL